ncbi:MAG: GNAT family N-acetyltransferase [Planctomycetales bacterium]|nr:GNAT family N-acetyltransferase [Planctomycetales bacterium]
MNVRLLRPNELSDELVQHWTGLCRMHSHLDSGFLRPEFAQDVAAVREETQVAVLDDEAGGPCFFAFQRHGNLLRPLGGRLSDYQAIIAPPDFRVDPLRLVAELEADCLRFDHLLDPSKSFGRWTEFTDGSPYLDLSNGFEAYQSANEAGSREIKETRRKRRKLERELGELEFRAFDDSDEAWESLVRWKSEQYDSSRITNVFSFEWTLQLLQRLRARQAPEFRGMLSSLYAGGRLVAAHFGLLCDGVLHYWFPAYEPGEAALRCSPGRILLLELAMAADQLGLRKIDLGRGMARYKRSAMSGCTEVAVGEVELRQVRRAMRCTWRKTRNWLKRSPLKYPLKWPARAAYRVREWLDFR